MSKKNIQFPTKKISLNGVKLLYPSLYNPFENKYSRNENDTRLYATTLLIEKGTTSEKENTKIFKEAVDYFKKMNAIKKIDRIPYVDGDIKLSNSPIGDSDDDDEEVNIKAGHFVISCRNKCNDETMYIRQPKVFLKEGEKLVRLESESDFRDYVVDGAYCTAFINLYFYDFQGTGISCSLDKIILYDKIDQEFKDIVEEQRELNGSSTSFRSEVVSKDEFNDIERGYENFCKDKKIEYKEAKYVEDKIPF